MNKILPQRHRDTEFEQSLNFLTETIIGAAIEVHRNLGPGLLESVYEACLEYELKKKNLKVERQKFLDLKYKELQFDAAFKIDLLVEEKVILELKCADTIAPVYEAQLLSYLRLSNIELGLLLNFKSAKLTDSIKRFRL